MTRAARLLYVDTDGDRRLAYGRALAELGESLLAVPTFAVAKATLRSERPTLLVTQLRLAEKNGIHLALWGRAEIPGLRCLLIGESDPALEHEAVRADIVFLRHGDVDAVVQATREAIARAAPRRHWQRPRITSSLAAEVAGKRARVIDIGYGGLRVESSAWQRPPLHTSFELRIPRYDVLVRVTWRWAMRPSASDRWWCGASVEELQARAGSSWRQLVDRLTSSPETDAQT